MKAVKDIIGSVIWSFICASILGAVVWFVINLFGGDWEFWSTIRGAVITCMAIDFIIFLAKSAGKDDGGSGYSRPFF